MGTIRTFFAELRAKFAIFERKAETRYERAKAELDAKVDEAKDRVDAEVVKAKKAAKKKL